tara:strand:+ start:314 stop:508 length:195 start_codon:yes stop_codon:yes gene_type:complete
MKTDDNRVVIKIITGVTKLLFINIKNIKMNKNNKDIKLFLNLIFLEIKKVKEPIKNSQNLKKGE